MGLNANVARMKMGVLPHKIGVPKDDLKPKEELKIEDSGQKPEIDDLQRTDALVDTYTYFSVYEGITSRLGNFYSETLAKMTGAPIINKKVFNQIYNGTLNNTVKKALEDAKSGNKLDFNLLAQNVMADITRELKACNYDPVQYQRNQLDNNINKNYNNGFNS